MANNKQNFLIKVWLDKNADESGPFKLLTSDNYNKLRELENICNDFPGIAGQIDNNGKRDPSSNSYYAFRIAFYYTGQINAASLNVNYFQDRIGDKPPAEFSPIIHIIQNDGNIFLSDKYTEKYKEAPRYRYIMDSGIWNYFASNSGAFEAAVKDIFSNWKNGYYNLYIAREYADLNARLTKESRLYKPSIGRSTGHGDEVSPFLFHSESLVKNKLNTENVSNYKWRLLLLDDKINKDKTIPHTEGADSEDDDKNRKIGILSSIDPNCLLTKAEILKSRISQMNIGRCKYILAENCETTKPLPFPKDYDIQIVCVETVNEALKLMEKNEFDIILLDYLLQNDYGYRLLKELNGKTYGSSPILIGPQEKNFFMFISAFTTAVNERLTLEGLSRDEEYWVIGEGACPTNTPELFKYRLVHLMERRLEQTGIKYLSYSNILKTVQKIYKVDNKEKNQEKKRERIEAVRMRAYETYHEILGFHYDYYVLREKDEGKSMLVDSFLKDKVHLGAMLEHLLQLVHLTAFGTVRQWPEIWEEYKFFSRTYNGNKEDLRQLELDIEKYIIDLKSNE